MSVLDPVKGTTQDPTGMPSTEPGERRLLWLQLPRRVVLLIIAFVLALLLIRALRGPLLAAGGPAGIGQQPDWSVSSLEERPVIDLVMERLPAALTLLGGALLVGLLMAFVGALVAVQLHRLEGRTGEPGSVLKGLGRLWVFGTAALPVFVPVFLLLLLFAVQFREWGLPSLPMCCVYTITPDNRYRDDLLDRLQHLILPSVALALLPAMLTGQAAARELTLPRERGLDRPWLLGLLKGLGTLLGQTGGLLSAAVLVETIYPWPGLGRLMFDAAYKRDLPVVLGTLEAYALVVLLGRLGAELFRWLERRIRVPAVYPGPEPNRWRRTVRTIWVVAALSLLLIPLGIAVAGATLGRVEAVQTDQGTRVLRGGLTTLRTVGLVSAAVLVPAALGGALSGLLASRRTLWSESLAELLLLPADVLLFIPAFPSASLVLLLLVRGQAGGPFTTSAMPSFLRVGLICALVLLPRAVRAYQTLWMAAPQRKRALVLGTAGTGALLLGTAFAGFGLVTSLEWSGVGTQPPLPTLGGMFLESLVLGFGAVAALWACSFSLYVAADALVGFFGSKEVLARLNE